MAEQNEALGAVRAEVAKAVKGQEPVVFGVLAALLVHGHVILEGVPGVAKTLTATALAHAISARFQSVRICVITS